MVLRLLNGLYIFISSTITLFVIVYAIFTAIYAYSWSYELANYLGLLIIRAIFIAILFIPSLILMPFELGSKLLDYGVYCFYLACILGVIGFISNPRNLDLN